MVLITQSTGGKSCDLTRGGGRIGIWERAKFFASSALKSEHHRKKDRCRPGGGGGGGGQWTNSLGGLGGRVQI